MNKDLINKYQQMINDIDIDIQFFSEDKDYIAFLKGARINDIINKKQVAKNSITLEIEKESLKPTLKQPPQPKPKTVENLKLEKKDEEKEIKFDAEIEEPPSGFDGMPTGFDDMD